MKKEEMISSIHDKYGRNVSKRMVKDVVMGVFDIISDVLVVRGELQVDGFGKFHTRERSARKGRNPRTGDTIDIAASTVIKFTPAAALKCLVNGKKQ